MFRNHLTIILRRLRKEKLFTFVNVFGLTIGLTAFLLIALYVRDELSFDKFHTNKDNIYRVISEHERLGINGTVPSDFVEFFSADIPEMESFTRVSTIGGQFALVSTKQKKLNSSGVYFVDQNFFEFFSFELLNSSSAGAFSGTGSVVITESFSNKIFGDKDPVGQELEFNKNEKYTVSAVATDPPKNSTVQFEALLYKHDYFKNQFEERNRYKNVITYVSNHFEHNRTAVELKMADARSKPPYSKWIEKTNYSLFALTDQRLNAPYENGFFEKNDIRYVMLFSTIGLVVLGLALINYINLVTAQSTRRKKEFGLRKVIGAGRKHLVYYQLMESTIVTMISFFFAFAIAERLMPIFNGLLDKEVALQYFSSDFFLWVVLAGLLLGFLAGIYPAYNIVKVKPLSLLNQKVSVAYGRGWFRKGLVFFQFVTSAILISVLLIINGQMNFLKEKDLGFNTDFLITIPLAKDSSHLFKVLKQEAGNVSGVQSASLSAFRLGGLWNTAVWDGANSSGKGANLVARDLIYADQDFVNTMDIEFYWKSASFDKNHFEENQTIINHSLAKKLSWLDDPEGKRLYQSGDQIGKEVIGIVDDFHMKSLKEKIDPLVFYPLKRSISSLIIRLEGNKGVDAMSQVGNIFESLFDRPFEYDYMDDQVKAFYKKEEGQFKLFKIYSSLAVFISLLGLVALTIYMTELRRKEVSIRKVLGASMKNLILMLNREYIGLVILAFSIASPIAYYAMQDWLAVFEYRITIHPFLFVGAFVGFLGLSWSVTLIQSLKVSRENPADVLREE